MRGALSDSIFELVSQLLKFSSLGQVIFLMEWVGLE